MTTPLRGRMASLCSFRYGSGIYLLPLLFTAGLALALTAAAHGQVNGVGQRPYLGWSSFSQQTIDGSFLTQANMIAQSDALASSGIEAHGFRYINIDSG